MKEERGGDMWGGERRRGRMDIKVGNCRWRKSNVVKEDVVVGRWQKCRKVQRTDPVSHCMDGKASIFDKRSRKTRVALIQSTGGLLLKRI